MLNERLHQENSLLAGCLEAEYLRVFRQEPLEKLGGALDSMGVRYSLYPTLTGLHQYLSPCSVRVPIAITVEPDQSSPSLWEFICETSAKTHLPIKIVGGGTNLYVPDSIGELNSIFIRFSGKTPPEEHLIGAGLLRFSAGTRTACAVRRAMDLGYDMSTLAGIPGTMGGAVCNNAGISDKGVNTADLVERIETFNFLTGKKTAFIPKEIPGFFGQRTSLFRRIPDKYAITEVVVGLDHVGFNEARERVLRRLEKRKAKDMEARHTAGSFYSNRIPDEIAQAIEPQLKYILRDEDFERVGSRVLARHVILAAARDLSVKGAYWTPNFAFLKVGQETTTYDVFQLIDETEERIRQIFKLEHLDSWLHQEVEFLKQQECYTD